MARRPPRDTRARARRTDSASTGAAPPASPPELVVVTRPESAMRASAGRFAALSGQPTDLLAKLLADNGATMHPLFGPTEERVAAFAMTSQAMITGEPSDLTAFYKVDAAPERLEALQAKLLDQDIVESAYIKPGAEPAAHLNDMARRPRRRRRRRPTSPPGRAISTRRPAASSALGLDAGWRTGPRHPHHRHRGRMALHARGPDRQPGRRRCAAPRSPGSTGATTAPPSSASTAATSTRFGVARHFRRRHRQRRFDLRRPRLSRPRSTRRRRGSAPATSSSSRCIGRARASTSPAR